MGKFLNGFAAVCAVMSAAAVVLMMVEKPVLLALLVPVAWAVFRKPSAPRHDEQDIHKKRLRQRLDMDDPRF